jgi:two-component system, NarL family, sensor kinase
MKKSHMIKMTWGYWHQFLLVTALLVLLSSYRIVQELLNNIVKHAAATEVLVQIMRHDNNLTITVEDNGKGFDVASAQNKGNGLGNVRSRVDYLKGHLDIQSIRGKGTSTHIDFVIQDT